MNKQQLAAKIWASANKMRSKIEANEYKDYILGFIFYKFLSDKEVRFLKENDYTDEYIKEVANEEDSETVELCQSRIGYFISYENLFSTWLDKGSDFDISNVRDALNAFDRLVNESHKKLFDGIFQTLTTGLSKLGTSSKDQTKAVSDLIQLIKDIPMDDKQDYDVLGFIYEYLISNFAANAGKKAGEFYTPHEVSELMSEIIANHLKDKNEIRIYDPCSGSGSLLITIGKSVSKHLNKQDSIKYYAQELKENTYNLTRMNLIMRGISPDNIVARNGDTLEQDWPYFDESDPIKTYNPLYVDAVTSNPPYSQKWDPSSKEQDPRYAGYGIAPKGKADFAFLLHDLYHVKPDGLMTIVLPHGVLFRGGEEGEIRKNLIEKNKIDTIIGLPANIFFGTGIPTIIMVLKQKRENTDVLIIDASKGFVKEGKNNKLRACDIKKITDAIKNRKDVDKFCKVVSRDEIRNNEYNLNIPRYVDSSEKAESWDIYASMFGGIPNKEIYDLNDVWTAFPSLKDELFSSVNESYSSLKTDKVKETISNNKNVKEFLEQYKNAFNGFDDELKDKLIKQCETSNISQLEDIISADIFNRLKDIPLINSYEAYQLLDDKWTTISNDLEIIQTEGYDSIKQVDPHLVIKKKGDKEEEVQDGWQGHIIPFEVAQKIYFTTSLSDINDNESRVSEIESEVEEIVDSLTEEEKEAEYFDNEKGSFVDKEVAKALKDKDLEDETREKLQRYSDLLKEKKALNKTLKESKADLHLQTKAKIESLSNEEISNMLNEKWIIPLQESIDSLSGNQITELTAKLEALAKKYEITFSNLEEQIEDTESQLVELVDQLEGNEFDMLGLDELKSILGGK